MELANVSKEVKANDFFPEDMNSTWPSAKLKNYQIIKLILCQDKALQY